MIKPLPTMDYHQPYSCFVCNRNVLGKGVLLSLETTACSKTPFLTKLMQLLGDAFMLVILEDDKICRRCVDLINQADKFEQDLRETQSIIRGFLNEKYDLNEELEFPTTDEEHQASKDNYMDNEESLHLNQKLSTNNVKYCFDKGHTLYKCLKNKEELFDRSAVNGNTCDVAIKSEPVNNSDQTNVNCIDSHKINVNCGGEISALLKELPEVNATFKKKHSMLGSSWSEVNQIVSESQELEVLKLKKENLFLEDNENANVETSVSQTSNPVLAIEIKTSRELVKALTDDSTLRNDSKSDIESFVDKSNSTKEIKYVLTSGDNNVKSSRGLIEKEFEDKLPIRTAEKKLSEECKSNTRSSNSNKLNITKRIRKSVTDNTFVNKKLRPILPKVSNTTEVVSSLYVLQHSDYSVCNEKINVCNENCNLSFSSENSSVYRNTKEIKQLVKDTNTNQCILTEEGQLSSVTKSSLTGNLNNHCTDIVDSKATKSNEKKHVQAARIYKCSFCPKSYKRKVTMRHHEVLHTGNYAHYCEFCGQGFATRPKLEYHQKSHTKEKSYICDVCGKTFTFRGTYWIHRKWHDNPYPYKCEDCGKPYRHSSRLAVHRRKHRGERPYKCSYCSLTFDNPQTFKRHLVLHTRQFPFRCVTCDQGFTTRSKYNSHLEKKHNTFVEKPTIDPKDYKMAVYSNEEISGQETTTEVDDFGENKCQIDITENHELIFHNNLSDCSIEIIIPPSTMKDSFPDISWLTQEIIEH